MHTLTNPTTSFLDAIITPAELKKLNSQQMRSLSQEIRGEIVKNVSKTGGHLASNLGIVEITLALHHVFDSPRDKILWDVGHQAYVHKMLTGRRKQFETLRQFRGLSGFINPLESEHDSFVAGHSSTSVSLAVGMAIARDQLKQKHKVIAVIGDGGLTGGMALEAINHLGHLQSDVLIILNDNEMSISENVGGFSQYMKRIKETFFYEDMKISLDQIEDRLDQARLTPAIWEMIQAVKQKAKERFDTPGIVFEKLGVNYSGPVDGHDIDAVIAQFEKSRQKDIPQIVHVITQKGKGYLPAEQDSIKYHGVAAFSLEPALSEKIEPGQPAKPKPKTYSDIFSEALIEVAELEPSMVAITPATAEGSGLVRFGKAYPHRFFDVAICEQHGVTMAAGMAKAGLKPVVSIYSTFLQRAMDQVIHDVAILNLPVLFGIDRGGLVEDGETHQGVFDIAFLRSIPNFTVLAPKDAQELRDMVFSALKESKGPVAIRFPRDKAAGTQTITPFNHIDFRKWEVVSTNCQTNTKNKQLVVLAYGAMVETAGKPVQELIDSGVNVTLVNARSAKPLDQDLLDSYLDHPDNKVVTLEEGCLSGGFGAAVLQYASERASKSPEKSQAQVFTVGVPDHFVEHGARSILLDLCGISEGKVKAFLTQVAGGLKS